MLSSVPSNADDVLPTCSELFASRQSCASPNTTPMEAGEGHKCMRCRISRTGNPTSLVRSLPLRKIPTHLSHSAQPRIRHVRIQLQVHVRLVPIADNACHPAYSFAGFGLPSSRSPSPGGAGRLLVNFEGKVRVAGVLCLLLSLLPLLRLCCPCSVCSESRTITG